MKFYKWNIFISLYKSRTWCMFEIIKTGSKFCKIVLALEYCQYISADDIIFLRLKFIGFIHALY